ncbi:MAG: CusA/CzcA family heavy metal efflux RND transporter [Phaeodactylibacter sp.]|nr:CusA/CzcA family heavy metal efflux RND transporter [Phaeodactylibacter sp.]
MINQIIAFSVRNKLAVALMTIALVAGGLWAMQEVPLDAVPDITNNQVQVITQAPNLGTEDIEQFVTYPVELALSNLPGVAEIRSISRFGLSVVTIVFEDEMGTYLPRQLVGEKLTEVREQIPDGFGKPEMGPITTGLGEIYQYTLEVAPEYREQYSPTDLRTIQDWIIRRQMAMVPGVVEVNSMGGYIKQYEVAVDPGRLKSMGVSIADVYQALAMNNQNTGGAYIEKNHRANFIRGEGLARSLEDLRQVVIKNSGGVPILVKDVAEVQYGHAVRYGALTQNGAGETVGGIIMMLKNANSNEVIGRVQERIALIGKSLPEGVSIEPFLDRSELIGRTTATVRTNLLEGGLIVIFVLVLLLGNWRGGLVVASTIPLSLLFAFIMMRAFGVWANLMSLGAIDFGIIIDGAVIIVESIVFTLSQRLGEGRLTAHNMDELTIESAGKMMNSAFFGQLIILIVFAPILALSGVEGKMFQPMALTFGFAMLGAMLLCLTYVPMAASLLLRVPKNNRNNPGEQIIRTLEKGFEPVLKLALRYSTAVLLSSVLMLALAVFVFSRLGGEFIPQLDEGDLAFHVIMKPGTALSETIEHTTLIEQKVLERFPEVEKVVSRIGVADVPTDPMPMDIADVFVILLPLREWTSAVSKDELIDKIKAVVNEAPGANYEFTQPIEMRFNELLTGVREDIAVKLFGEDLQVLAKKAEEMGRIIASVEGVADMRVEATSGLPQITVEYDRAKVAQYGLNIQGLNEYISAAFAGGQAGMIFEGEKRFVLAVRLGEEHRQNIENLRSLYINLPDGTQIPLKEVASINYQSGPMQISRENTNRRTYVGINVRGRDIESLVGDIRQRLDEQLELPAGYYIRFGGAFENLEKARKRLQMVVPLALALIFLLAFFALGSFRQTLMIYMAIPMAAIGGVFSLWARDMPFSISAGVGFIVLFGVAVLNGLVLINGMNELEGKGIPLADRILQGTRRRIRPILLTASTDILGFLPMAVSASSGAEVQRPLATVVIGGLLTSTLLTLVILPILYRWVQSLKERPFSLRLKGKGWLCFLFLVGAALAPAGRAAAQEGDTLHLSLPDALALARENAPRLRHAILEVQQAEALLNTAQDWGNTILFTGGEEIRARRAEGTGPAGIYTILGIGQQNMDPLGVPARRAYRQEVKKASEQWVAVRGQELEYKVEAAWYAAQVARQRLGLARRLDSLYRRFAEVAELRLEVEAASRLEWLTARNRSQAVRLGLEKSHSEYLEALAVLQGWLFTNLPIHLEGELELPEAEAADSSWRRENPILEWRRQNIAVNQASVELTRSALLPRFNAQAAWQAAGGDAGLFSFQVGVNLPLFRKPEQAEVEAAQLKTEISRQELRLQELQLNNRLAQLQQRRASLMASMEFYQQEALPLAREQMAGAGLSYREGAIDYTEYILNLEAAIRVEQDYLDALQEWCAIRAEIRFIKGE